MMDGITILHQYEAGQTLGGQVMLAIFTIGILVFVVWNIIRKLRKQTTFMSTRDTIIATVIAAVMFAAMLWVGTWKTHVEYKVTIDESVSYVEFTENYKVISREGSIYTIREIEGE